MGYFIRVIHYWKMVYLHAPTEHWQHRPQTDDPDALEDRYWIGPITNQGDAERAAQDTAVGLNYQFQYCKACFPERWCGLRVLGERDPVPDGRKPRKKRQSGIWLR